MDDLEPMMRSAVEALDALAKACSSREDRAPSELVALAQAVSDTRASLYAELMRQGWIPPEHVPEDLLNDERLAKLGISAGYDHPVPLPEQHPAPEGHEERERPAPDTPGVGPSAVR